MASSSRRRLRLPRLRLLVAAVAVAAFVPLGLSASAGYAHAYWLYRGFPPPVRPAPVAAGTLTTRTFYTRALHRRAKYDIYLPPGYAREAAHGRRFPVLYLLHSPEGVPQGIFTAGALAVRADVLIHEHRMKPMIVVVPRAKTSLFGNDTEWANANAGRYESFVLDAVHFVDRRYATFADRQHRGIGGLSMGGYGAMNVALRHMRVFSVVQSWSGYFTQTATGPFTGSSPRRIAANSPMLVAPRVAPVIRRLGLRAWIYRGTRDDTPAATTRAFVRVLRASGADVRFAIFRGGHNWRLWRAEVPRMLVSASRWFDSSPTGGQR